MKLLFTYILIIYIFFLIWSVPVYSNEYIINDKNFKNLPNILKEIQGNNKNILFFEEGYYDISEIDNPSIGLSPLEDISLIGRENGTIFDFKNTPSSIDINYINGVYALQVHPETYDFYLDIINCTFRNSKVPLLSFMTKNLKIDKNDDKNLLNDVAVLFDNCQF
ncbi:hypothetical protein PIROE2DRAFT_11292, partial [Piromyces sp. E2]